MLRTALAFAAYLTTIADQQIQPPIMPEEAVTVLQQYVVLNPIPARCKNILGTPGCKGHVFPCIVFIDNTTVDIFATLVFAPQDLPWSDTTFTIADRSLRRSFVVQIAHPEAVYAPKPDGKSLERVMTQDSMQIFALEMRSLRMCVSPGPPLRRSPGKGNTLPEKGI